MAQGYTTTVNAVPSTFAYDRRLLDRLVNSFVYVGFGEEKKLSANNGASITFRRYTNLSAATTALTEGVTPAGSSLAKTDISATVYQYGDYVTYTDWVDMVGVDANVIKIIDDLQADQVKDTFDQLCRTMLVASTNLYICSDATPTSLGSGVTDVTALLTTTALDYACNFLERGNVKPLKEKTLPGVQTATVGLDPAYIAFVHPDIRPTLESSTFVTAGFVKVSQYPANASILPGEIGQYKRIKFIATTNAYVDTTGGDEAKSTTFRSTGGTYGDVYKTVIIGKGAFGNVKLDGGALKTIVKPLGYKDPLNQEGSVGWKGTWGGLILDQNRIITLWHLAPAL